MIHQALQFLETPEGRQSLVRTARSIIEACETSKKHSHLFGSRPVSELPREIDHFLTCMRTNFPVVRLHRLEGEATASRFGGINDMRRFNPKVTGDFVINRDIMNALIVCVHQKKQSHVTCFKFLLVISIAHEIVHFLYGFLTGEKASMVATPSSVVLDGYRDGGKGESGRYWEGIYLGGVVEMWSIVGEPLGKCQSGQPYIFEHGRPSAKRWPISVEYAAKFVAGQVVMPIQKVGSTKTREELRKDSRTKVTNLRWRKRARNDKGIPSTSPPRKS